jgi:hypothetical protein
MTIEGFMLHTVLQRLSEHDRLKIKLGSKRLQEFCCTEKLETLPLGRKGRRLEEALAATIDQWCTGQSVTAVSHNDR